MTIKMITGDCRDVLKTLATESVHCVVCSPPYWGLRDYGTAKWEGGDAACDHFFDRTVGMRASTLGGGKSSQPAGSVYRDCMKCGAIRIDNQLGLEPDFLDYVAAIVEVFREVRRVLRKDGTCWLNLGDSYAGGNGIGRNDAGRNFTGGGGNILGSGNPGKQGIHTRETNLKPKDLVGIPWRVAFALQEDGWYLRQDIIWSKSNPMPESVTDRCTKAHEYLFLLSKSPRYYYDQDAIREPHADSNLARAAATEKHGGTDGPNIGSLPAKGAKKHPNGSWMRSGLPGVGSTFGGWNQDGRNKRSVWEVTTQPFSEAHFATFPPALIEPCIKAGTSEKGCCSKCGAPWVRQVEHVAMIIDHSERTHDLGQTRSSGTMLRPASSNTIGWSPSCKCDAPVVPCTVLDPFAGAGTTGLVADRLQRSAILIELNPDYSVMSERRIVGDAPLFADVSRETWAEMWAKPFDFSQQSSE